MSVYMHLIEEIIETFAFIAKNRLLLIVHDFSNEIHFFFYFLFLLFT